MRPARRCRTAAVSLALVAACGKSGPTSAPPSTLAHQETDHDRADPSPPEYVAYDWKIDGKPPVLSLQRTANELNKKRHPGLTKPGVDPLLSAGERADIPLRA